ncbi:DUF4013 domain-containing protein [Atopobium sp. oral taxon 810]|uniref:DUF4013 domain-containing protein n=1 Tax=Atopobium sp. oral taxon 810 TaxID=712158 RepID=UPI0003961153|nr:DUF4013 domain-containing protein [Atopobium sp. oral taxon 810]ERI06297.1 hypothetical protein HMPREF9069_00237 [Atopobium sp. oral taxon 810 str. F0209]
MTDEGHYYKRSLALLRHDRGWIKPLLVMAAANFVPIAGPLGCNGYAVEWARLVAWGVDAAPKQRKVRVGECISAGWRAFVGALWVGLSVYALNLLFTSVFKGGAVTSTFSILLSFIASFLVPVAALHATIYHDFKAGWQIKRIWSLIKADHKGALHLIRLYIVLQLVVGLILSIVWMAILILVASQLSDSYLMLAYSDVLHDVTASYILYAAADILRLVAANALPCAIAAFISSLGFSFTQMIQTCATGLWLRKFDVPTWQESNKIFEEKN